MGLQNSIKRLSNDNLINAVKSLVAQSNQTTAALVAHLAEVERRRLHLRSGYDSMFAYCTEALKLSRGGAYRRIAASRLSRRFPRAL